jgi:hypothetical protein
VPRFKRLSSAFSIIMKIRLVRLLQLAGLLALALFQTGCATMADAQKGKGTGTAVAYAASFEEIWAALPAAVTEAGLEFISANRDDRSVLAQRGITAFSYGENVALFVTPVAPQKQQIEVVSKKAMATNVFAPDWAKPIFAELDKKFSRAP